MNNVGWLLLAAVVGAAAFLAGIRMEKGRQARRVKQLNHLLERVMRGDYAADWSAFQEGEWSILAGQLELVVKRTDHMVKQLDREKGAIREFIADVSHQIKTPLTGLLTYLDLLEGGEKDPGKRKQLEKCLYLAERMHELIRTLLELARLDADAVELKMETHSAAELLHAAAQSAAMARPEAKADFEFHVPAGLTLRCDRKWFIQAVLNLFINALDYSRGKEPVRVAAFQGDGMVRIEVFNACLLPPETDPQKLFERFYRMPGAGGGASQGGFGIGLAMTESILRLHKGSVRAVRESEGLRMILTLPELSCAVSW